MLCRNCEIAGNGAANDIASQPGTQWLIRLKRRRFHRRQRKEPLLLSSLLWTLMRRGPSSRKSISQHRIDGDLPHR